MNYGPWSHKELDTTELTPRQTFQCKHYIELRTFLWIRSLLPPAVGHLRTGAQTQQSPRPGISTSLLPWADPRPALLGPVRFWAPVPGTLPSAPIHPGSPWCCRGEGPGWGLCCWEPAWGWGAPYSLHSQWHLYFEASGSLVCALRLCRQYRVGRGPHTSGHGRMGMRAP